jgi:hypothetical protein
MSEHTRSTKRIYVVVAVSYDYYRFQDNLVATTSKQTAEKIAAKKANGRPIARTVTQSKAYDDGETPHIYIETF